MTSASKFYSDLIRGIPCADLYHPNKSCWECASGNFRKIFPIVAQFYTPMVLAQFARSLNNFSANTVKEFVQTVFLLTFSTYMGSAVGQSLVCVFYNMFGRFPHYSLLCFFPAFFGNMWGFIMPPKITNYITNGLCVMIAESYLCSGDYHVVRMLTEKSAVRTLLFMTMSMLIMDSQAILKSDVFWFIKAKLSQTDHKPTEHIPSPMFDAVLPTEQQICDHPQSCDSYLYQGALTNFKIGLGIEIVRAIVSNVGQLRKSPLSIFSILVDMKTGLLAFLVGYTSIYRATTCCLNRYQQECNSDSRSLAALTAGSAYFLYPNFTILAHATICSIKMLWYRTMLATKPTNAGDFQLTKSQQIGRLLDSLPMGKFFYVMSIGYVFHLRTFYPWMCPGILLKAVHYTSGMNADPAMMRFSDFLLGYKQAII